MNKVYIQYCGSSEPHATRLVEDLKELLAGRLDLLTFIYPCHSPTEQRWYSLIGLPLSLDKRAGVALLHVNLTDMLPLPTVARSMRVKAERWRGEQVRPTTNLEIISAVIERSVSENLSSQLNRMFATRHADSTEESRPEKSLERRELDHTLASTLLSERQMQVLRLLGEGKTNKEIASALFRSPHTIKLHVSAILQRLKLKSRTEAALLASKLVKGGSSDLTHGSAKSWKKADMV